MKVICDTLGEVNNKIIESEMFVTEKEIIKQGAGDEGGENSFRQNMEISVIDSTVLNYEV